MSCIDGELKLKTIHDYYYRGNYKYLKNKTVIFSYGRIKVRACT